MHQLHVTAGPGKGSVYKIGTGISTIGREQTNSIQVHDYEISRRHAELHVRSNDCVLVDLSSSNGTTVNGESIATRTLESGDQIRFGQSVVEYVNCGSESTSDRIDGDTIGTANDDSRGDDGTIGSNARPLDQLMKTQSNLEVLYHAALATGSYQSSESLLQRILDLVFCWISAHRACILIRENEQEHVIAKSIVSGSPDKNSTKPFDMEYAVIKYVFRKREGVVVNDILNDDRFPVVIDAKESGKRQIICAPIKSRYGIRGVIYVDRSRFPEVESEGPVAAFDDQQMKLLIAVGLHAAVAIENSDHYSILLQSERMTAVGSAMASLSHHIKNILQSINGGNHLIEDGLANQQFGLIESGWQIVQRNQENLSNLVMDMLSFSKSTVPRLTDTDLKLIVDQAVELVVRNADNTKMNINVDVEVDLPRMRFEPDLLRRAIRNVLLASISFCRENSGGDVVVRVQHDPRFKTTTIEIADNGITMTQLELQLIFDPLVINERSSRIGLGLAVAKKIINEMNGEIIARPNSKQGSVFLITFKETHLADNATPNASQTGDKNKVQPA